MKLTKPLRPLILLALLIPTLAMAAAQAINMTPWLQAWAEPLWVLYVLSGASFHWLHEYANGRTSSGFFEYWVRDQPGSSISAGIAVALAIAAGLKAGSLESVDPTQLLFQGIGAGFLLDHFFNQGSAPSAPPAATIAAPPASPVAGPGAAQGGWVSPVFLAGLAALCAALLIGCAGTGKTVSDPAQTDLRAAREAYATIAVVVRMARTETAAGRWSQADYDRVVALERTVRASLDSYLDAWTCAPAAGSAVASACKPPSWADWSARLVCTPAPADPRSCPLTQLTQLAAALQPKR